MLALISPNDVGILLGLGDCSSLELCDVIEWWEQCISSLLGKGQAYLEALHWYHTPLNR